MIRLFTAVSIAQDVQELITELITELKSAQGLSAQDLPGDIRFVPPKNWHFTLTFLGYQDESVVPIIKETIKSAVFRKQNISFEKVIFGPSGRNPRMLWLTTSKETSDSLGKIKKELEDIFETKGIKWRRELRPYRAHLTIARFPQTPLKKLPQIEKRVDWQYEAEEVHLMESVLKRTGAEYEIL